MVVMMEMTYIYWASASIWKSCAAMASWSLSWRAYWNTTEHLYWTWNNVLIPIDFSTMLVLCAYIQYINIFKKTYILFSMYKIKFITILSYHLYRSTKYRTITNTTQSLPRVFFGWICAQHLLGITMVEGGWWFGLQSLPYLLQFCQGLGGFAQHDFWSSRQFGS